MKNILIVNARFATSDKDYHYFVPGDDDPKIGDYIITSTSWNVDTNFESYKDTYKNFNEKFCVARVTGVLNDSDKATKFYVALISLDFLKRRNKDNQALMDKVNVRKEAKRKLDQMLKEQSMVEVYRRLAETNEEAARLLKILED